MNIKSLVKSAANLESMRSQNLEINIVSIISISQDNIYATVMDVNPDHGAEKCVARIINPLGVTAPLNVTRYQGILFGSPKNPIAVMLVDVSDNIHPDISYNGSDSLQSGGGKNTQIPVIGKIENDNKDDNLDEKAYRRDHPHDNMVVVKPLLPSTTPNNSINDIPKNPNLARDIPTGYLMVAEDKARIAASSNCGIEIDKYNGITATGKFNITAPVGEVRIGGMWRLNPMLMYMIPSTAITPIPALIFSIPGKALLSGVEDMIKDVFS
jgi:hypothetical protein